MSSSAQSLPKPKWNPEGDPDLARLLADATAHLPADQARIAKESITTAFKFAGDPLRRLDRKIVNAALKELRHAASVFEPYRGVRKVSIFGSARVDDAEPEYRSAREFAKKIGGRGWMVITGAGPGIMTAGHEGAGGAKSFGANIRLPMDEAPNRFIAEDEKLINFKYFFTRKLTFIKEADAFVLLPGGFGTLDETFELLTLTQTGKTEPTPIVLLDRPGGSYWSKFDRFVSEELLDRSYVNATDLKLYACLDDPDAAVEEVERFYRVYHSQRIVNRKLIVRLNHEVAEKEIAKISSEFSERLGGTVTLTQTTPEEVRDDDLVDLPRILVDCDWQSPGVMRLLIDRLNEAPHA